MSVYQVDSTVGMNHEIAALGRRVEYLERRTFFLTKVLALVGGAFVGALPTVVLVLVK